MIPITISSHSTAYIFLDGDAFVSLLTCPLTPLKVKGLQVLQPGWWEDGVPLLESKSGDREA